MGTGDSEEPNRMLKQRIGDLEDIIRYLERQLALYESESTAAPLTSRRPSPEGTRLVVTVCRNNEPFGEVVIANGGWSASPGVPDLLQSEIVLAYCLDNITCGDAKIGGDTYAWGEKPSLPPS
jgi:hypothetical protein